MRRGEEMSYKKEQSEGVIPVGASLLQNSILGTCIKDRLRALA